MATKYALQYTGTVPPSGLWFDSSTEWVDALGAATTAPALGDTAVFNTTGDTTANQVMLTGTTAAPATLQGITGTIGNGSALAAMNATFDAATTLTWLASGFLHVNGPAVINQGGMVVQAGTLTINENLTGPLFATPAFTNLGTITAHGALVISAGGGSFTNDGTIVADSGTTVSTADGRILADTGQTGTIQLSGAATLAISTGAVGQNVVFNDTLSTLQLGTSGVYTQDLLTGFGTDGLGHFNSIYVPGGGSAQANVGVVWIAASHTLQLTQFGSSVFASFVLQGGSYTQSSFSVASVANGGFANKDAVITASTIACFARGTHVETLEGPVAVERLRIGQQVTLARGGTRPIVWIGRRQVDCLRHVEPRAVWPIRVAAHAFGKGRPLRDLYLSPEHAVFSHGVLIPVRELANGHSIVQMFPAQVEYWHVELDAHDVLLAERMAAESYIDNGTRCDFDDQEALTLHPLFAGSDTWQPCLPIVRQGVLVEAARAHVASRSRGGCRRAHDAAGGVFLFRQPRRSGWR